MRYERKKWKRKRNERIEFQQGNGKKDVYSRAMHGFGREKGREIYRLLRDII